MPSKRTRPSLSVGRRLGSLLALAALAGGLGAADPTPAEVLAAWPQGGGFAVALAPDSGRFLSGLANDGRILVHGLCLDDARRDALRGHLIGEGIYGLASVATWQDAPVLPYASRLVSILVADLDALGAKAPSPAELERVVAPDGLLYLRRMGAWQAVRPGRPAGLDDWGHFDHGPDGNPVSRDTVAGPARQQQWINESMPFPLAGNPAGYDPGAGLRISGRYAICDINDNSLPTGGVGVKHAWTLQARDAWNGTLLWTRPRDPAVARRRWSLAADASGVYGYLATGADLVALDPATGGTLRTFPGTTPVLGNGKPGLDSETVCIRLLDGVVVVTVNGAVHCFDKRTAERRWSFSRDGSMAYGMVVDPGTGRVYALLGTRRTEDHFKGRWPASKQVQALLALDLASGKPVWECTGIASVPIGAGAKKDVRGPGQIVPMGDRVVVFGNASVYNNDHPYIATVAASDGRVLFSDDQPFTKDYNRSGYNMLARDGAIWFAGHSTRIWRYDPMQGTTAEVMSYAWNSRCTRFTATPTWFLFGQSGWFAKDLSGEQIPVARSGCAIGNIPANGLTYFTPNACGCITMLRGFHATGSDPVPPPIPDGERLRTGGTVPAPASAPAEPLPSGPVARDWTRAPRLAAVRGATVAAGDLEIRAIVHQHRIEARRQGALAWSTVADARISGAPVVVGDRVVFGAHDGCVYAVALADGTPLFRYQLAPAHRLIVANGQVESAWPVYGLAVREGRVVASAGTHPGIGGGVAVAILDPRTGRPEWTTLLTLRPNIIPSGGGRITIIDRSFLNSVPRIEEGRILLGDGGRGGGGFSFRPEESRDEILKRLHEPPPKKR